MSSQRTALLYTPEMLALAVSLADYPLDPNLPRTGEARSRTCGSTVRLGCSTDASGQIVSLGLQAQACAVGQAAAALFAQAATGRAYEEVHQSRGEIARWLEGGEALPSWPGIDALSAARAHSARHGAILLAWDAGLDALSKAEVRG